MSYILKGVKRLLFAAGFFYACTVKIYGFVPPCNSIMELLPLRCKTTGKAEPFFIPAYNKQNLSVMSYTEKKRLEDKGISTPNRPSHDTAINQSINEFINQMEALRNVRDYFYSYAEKLDDCSDFEHDLLAKLDGYLYDAASKISELAGREFLSNIYYREEVCNG